jgi:hypothetical protein
LTSTIDNYNMNMWWNHLSIMEVNYCVFGFCFSSKCLITVIQFRSLKHFDRPWCLNLNSYELISSRCYVTLKYLYLKNEPILHNLSCWRYMSSYLSLYLPYRLIFLCVWYFFLIITFSWRVLFSIWVVLIYLYISLIINNLVYAILILVLLSFDYKAKFDFLEIIIEVLSLFELMKSVRNSKCGKLILRMIFFLSSKESFGLDWRENKSENKVWKWRKQLDRLLIFFLS